MIFFIVVACLFLHNYNDNAFHRLNGADGQHH